MVRDRKVTLGVVLLLSAGLMGFATTPPTRGSGEQRSRVPERGENAQDERPQSREGEGRPMGRNGMRVELENLPLEVFRARMEQRLDFVNRQERQIKQCLALLDEGGTVAEAALVYREGRGDGTERPVVRSSLSESDRDRILTLMAEHMPGMHEQITKLQEANPEGANEMLARLGGMFLDAMQTKEADAELGTAQLAELRASWGVLNVVHRIRMAYAEGGEEAVLELKPDLAKAIAMQFKAKAELTNLELRRLRDRVAQLETRAVENVSLRDDKIGKMTDDIAERTVRRVHRTRHIPPQQSRPKAADGSPQRETDSTPSGG